MQRREFLEAERERLARQPGLGLAGMLLVLPVAVLLGAGAGGLEPSLRVLGPLSTFALPVVAMIAFWWEDWPGSRLRRPWSGLVDTALVVVGAVVLTVLGQLVVGRFDLRGVFDATPGRGHAATFPAAMPLAAASFVVMLELTLVSEGWPLRRFGRLTAGVAALAVSWVIALGLYLLLVRFDPPPGSELRASSGPLSGAVFSALLVGVGVWQVWFFVALRGWPFADVARRALRLVLANVVVLGGGVVTYLALHNLLGWSSATFSAVTASVVAAGLLHGMLLDGWPRSPARPGRERVTTLAIVAVLSALVYRGLTACADGVHWRTASTEEWVAYAGLNALGVGVILHVAVGRRWPFVAGDERATNAAHA